MEKFCVLALLSLLLVPTGLKLTEKDVSVVWHWGKDPGSPLSSPVCLEGAGASDTHCLDVASLGLMSQRGSQ